MISSIISRLVILVFGTLYPAYASYKAVRTKNLKEYVKWMMYWIVFALFTCTETITDVFLSWFPFYYEVKIVLVLWLLSPATKGSSILYRKFVHPALCRREQEIDEYIAKAKDQGYHTVLNLGTKGVNYATTVIMQTAIKGGGGLVQQLRKSYSLSDLTECEPREEITNDETDDVLTEPRLIRRVAKSVYVSRRSASESNSRSPLYFPEVDVDVRSSRSNRSEERDFSHIKSTEDISSGYSSADNSASLIRTASLGPTGRAKRPAKTAITTIKRPQAAEDNEVIIEVLRDDDTFEYTNMPPLINLSSPLFVSNSDPPFIYQCIGDQIKIVQILGNSPLRESNMNQNNNLDQRDQKETIGKTSTQDKTSCKENKTDIPENLTEKTVLTKENNVNLDIPVSTVEHKDNKKLCDIFTDKESKGFSLKGDNKVPEPEINDKVIEIVSSDKVKDEIGSINRDNNVESANLVTSLNEIFSAESDDEASFGTPDVSPKNRRKSPKGKYGKGKAPPPPPKLEKTVLVLETNNEKMNHDHLDSELSTTTSQESLVDFVNKLPNTGFKETGSYKYLHVINPIAEKKRRHKGKSPNRIPKGNSSGIGKLLQLPSKLAFWHKSDDKPKADNVSTSSGDYSRRSSTVEKSPDEFEDCSDFDTSPIESDLITKITKKSEVEIADDQFSFSDAADFESEVISHDLIEKSDALKKLIEAKLESHPEYKYIPLNEEVPTTSKSTDV